MKKIDELKNVAENGQARLAEKETKSKRKFGFKLLLSGVIAAVAIVGAVVTFGSSLPISLSILVVGAAIALGEVGDAFGSRATDIKEATKAQAEYEVTAEFVKNLEKEVKQEIAQNNTQEVVHAPAKKAKINSNEIQMGNN